MTNLQAALGLAQLERLDESLVRKREIGLRYQELLSDTHALQLPLDSVDYADNLYWVFGIILRDTHVSVARLMQHLATAGVGTRPFFYPLHKQPILRSLGYFFDDFHPVADSLSTYGLYIPSGLAISDSNVKIVSSAVAKALDAST